MDNTDKDSREPVSRARQQAEANAKFRKELKQLVWGLPFALVAGTLLAHLDLNPAKLALAVVLVLFFSVNLLAARFLTGLIRELGRTWRGE